MCARGWGEGVEGCWEAVNTRAECLGLVYLEIFFSSIEAEADGGVVLIT